MKTYIAIVTAVLVSSLSVLFANETSSWKPDMGYLGKHKLAGKPTSWDFSEEAVRAEYQMLYLLEAHKNAVMLAKEFEHKVVDGKISHDQIVRLRKIGGNLDEVLKASYDEVTPYFTTKMNSTLLLMMLYHFEVYCFAGDSCESWPDIINPLQELYPKITVEAKKLAKKGIENLQKVKK